jgi:hypothetical protein
VPDHHAPDVDGVRKRGLPAPEYETHVLTIPAAWSRNDVRKMLAEQAEHGRWELARSRVYLGGHRRVWLRRRVIRVSRTF